MLSAAEVADLKASVGGMSHLGGIRELEVASGPDRGQRIIEVTTGNGLQFEIRPDRSFDIGRLLFRGVPYGWEGAQGLGAGQGSLPQTLGGFFFTCGFDHIRQPETALDPFTGKSIDYPLHGSLPFTRATVRRVCAETKGNTPVFVCEGEVVQRRIDNDAVRLHRRYEAPFAGRSFSFTDAVSNIGTRPTPFMVMYHMNCTYPLLGPDTVVEFSDATRDPWPVPAVAGPEDQAVYVDATPVVPDSSSRASVTIRNHGDRGMSPLSIAFDTTALPFLQLWRGRAQGVDLLAIEPTTNRRASRAELQTGGEVRVLDPGQTVTLTLIVSFGDP